MATEATVFYSDERVCTYMTKGGVALVFTENQCTVPAEYVDELKATAADPYSPISTTPRSLDASVAESIKVAAAKTAVDVLKNPGK